jgi:glycosyltransferase involved in cell wall biosynthesis
LRIALVHDWLTGMRGGEKVLEALCERFPEAPIYTIVHVPGSVSPSIESHPIHSSFVQRLPMGASSYQRYLPLLPAAIERFDLRGYDLVLSTSHCVAKGARVHPGTLHLCYCHTPMRYVWPAYEEYFGKGHLAPPASWIMPLLASWLRTWDVVSNVRVDSFAANSRTVADRIRRWYGRDARVIHPWVDTERFDLPIVRSAGDYDLILSALVPYKRIDVAVEAYRGRREQLIVAGTGVERDRLVRMAPRNVRFLGWLDPEETVRILQGCRALLFPGEEDFGIVPVEAMACGKPVIALGSGGATETVIGGTTGVFFDEVSPEAIGAAVDQVSALLWDPAVIRANALRFGRARFESEIDAWLTESAAEGAVAGAGRGAWDRSSAASA